ncbi:MAG: DUF188 domain-containing protein, partial [Clostridiales bacterium]|nr:DUF188 domain-containing protein [Clostridiales bacterium]
FTCTNGEVLQVAKGVDSVDFAIANRLQKGDIVITQDYGLAALCLGKGALVLRQDGYEYTDEQIQGLLMMRYENQKIRQRGGRVKGPKKRSEKDNQMFCQSLEKILKENRREP